MRISVSSEGFTLRTGWFPGKRHRWDSVASISATRADRLTYEALFLIVGLKGGGSVSLGEFDKGFADFERALAEAFPGYNAGWRAQAEAGPRGVYVPVWSQG